MPKTLRYTVVAIREMFVSVGPFLFLAVGLLALAYWWLDPNPPKTVTLATGPAQSAYDEFGKRYAKALAGYGITVKLLPSQGSQENLEMLRDGRADLGFVQGGTSERKPDDEENLESLGSLFVEPLWLFYREAVAPDNKDGKDAKAFKPLSGLAQLQGLKVNVGTAGSGVPSLFAKLLEANRIDPAGITLSQLEQTPAVTAFLAGELDAVVFASAPEAVMVQLLLQTPGIRLMDFPQSEAYARRFAFLTPATLPRGVVDLAADVPPQNLRLVAPTTALITRSETHPALLQLFSQTAQALHSGAGWFTRARQFPNLENTELPIAKQAERTIKNGPPLMQRYLPFWMANLIDRMWLALGVIVALLLPLSRIVPPLYDFRIRSRIFRWYAQLRDIEERLQAGGADTSALREELDALDSVAGKIAVPLSYADELYSLRSNIQLVRRRMA
jgi:TRAP-type uncharacterized transport system substrate-binding protein